MLLAEVVDRDNDDRDDFLRKGGVPMPNIHQQFQQQEIEQEIEEKSEGIAKKLYPPPQVGLLKYHILTEQKAGDIGIGTCHYQGCRMGPEHEKP